MTTVTTRAVKGSALTYAEMDANFNDLNNNKLEINPQASEIVNTPSGNISAIDVQSALNELDTEKLDATATSLNGTTIPATSTLLITTDIGVSVQGYDVDTMKLDVAQTLTAVKTQTPTSASSASFTWPVDTQPNHVLTTTGTLTMGAPTGLTEGSFYFLEIIYGGTHTVTWNAAFKGLTGVTLTSTTGAKDAFMFRAEGGNLVCVGFRANVGV